MDPLRRTLQVTLTKSLVVDRLLFDGFLAQADKAVDKCFPGRDVLSTLLNYTSHNLPSDSRVCLIEQLRTFQVEQGTIYDSFCQQLFVSLDKIIFVEDTPAGVEASYAIYRVRDHISHQFPKQLHLVFTSKKVTANLPYSSAIPPQKNSRAKQSLPA